MGECYENLIVREEVCFRNTSLGYTADIPNDKHICVFFTFSHFLFTLALYYLLKLYKPEHEDVFEDALCFPEDTCNSSKACPKKPSERLRSKSCMAVLCASGKKDVREFSIEDLDELTTLENKCDQAQEYADEYCYGGYMPILEGQILNDAYAVVRKLGFGQFSTVWLCKNLKDTSYVAIKVAKSSVVYEEVAKEEIQLLRKILSADPQHPGRKKIIQLLDTFHVTSPNGTHMCLTFEVMGPSLLYLIQKSEYMGLQVPCVRHIMRQILEGVLYLHNVCQVIHTDLKPENILIKVKDSYIQRMVDTVEKYKELGVLMPKNYVNTQHYDELFQKFQRRNDIEIPNTFRFDSYPNDTTMGVIPYQGKFKLDNYLQGPLWIDAVEVKIADLGNACSRDYHFQKTIQTKQYRALEVIIGAEYDLPVDLWSVGCIAFELATGEYLFCPKSYDTYDSDEDHLGLIWELLDGIPKYISVSGKKSSEYFDKQGNLLHIDSTKLKIWKLEDVLVEKYHWKRVDAIPFAAFVLGLIEPDPQLRFSAAEALNSLWINMDQDYS